jgi:hypothetical protein
MATPELSTQKDLWGHDHPPFPVVYQARLVRNLSQICYVDANGLATVGFLEFERLYNLPEGKLGLDVNLEDPPNLELIYIAKPPNEPPTNIYFVRGNFQERVNILRYAQKGSLPRKEASWEELFFAFLYPKLYKNRLERHLQSLSVEEANKLLSATPLSQILSFDYFYLPNNLGT